MSCGRLCGTDGKYDSFKDIKIEHRDADGRLLTRKEAYLQMSYRFHGHGPKQKKTEIKPYRKHIMN